MHCVFNLVTTFHQKKIVLHVTFSLTQSQMCTQEIVLLSWAYLVGSLCVAWLTRFSNFLELNFSDA